MSEFDISYYFDNSRPNNLLKVQVSNEDANYSKGKGRLGWINRPDGVEKVSVGDYDGADPLQVIDEDAYYYTVAFEEGVSTSDSYEYDNTTLFEIGAGDGKPAYIFSTVLDANGKKLAKKKKRITPPVHSGGGRD